MKAIKNTNIKAFTIFELLITMLVTSILITLVISVFFRFNEFFHLRQKHWEDNTELLHFIKTIGDDFDNANTVSSTNQSLLLRNRGKDNIEYIFNIRHVIRLQAHKSDTFNYPITIQEINTININSDIVDKVVLSSNNPNVLEFNLKLIKDYKKRYMYHVFMNSK